MTALLTPKEIKDQLLKSGFLVDYAENLTPEELKWWQDMCQAQLDQDNRDFLTLLDSEQVREKVAWELYLFDTAFPVAFVIWKETLSHRTYMDKAPVVSSAIKGELAPDIKE